MRAARYSQLGPAASVLSVDQIPIPKPGPNQVRVKLAFSGINPTDVKTRAGLTPRDIAEFQIPHLDGSGVIDIVGANVDPSHIGERVWVMMAAFDNVYGTAADYCIVDVARVRHLPADASLELGATLGCAVQVAKWAGATVIATASTEARQQVAREAGADFVYDYRDPDIIYDIREAVGAVDRIIEVNLPANLEMDLEVSKPGTVVVNYAADGEDPVLPRRRLMTAGLTLEFMLLYTVAAEKYAAAVDAVDAALADGALTMPPARYFELEEIVEAHEAQEAGSSERLLIRC